MDLNKWVGINPAHTPYNHRLKWKPINFQATPPQPLTPPMTKVPELIKSHEKK